MFAKLPLKLTAPFGLLTDETKLAFRSKPNGISKLISTRHIPENDSYWDQVSSTYPGDRDPSFFLTLDHAVRRAFLDAPENVATLVRVVASRLFNLVSDHTFPAQQTTTSVTSYASSLIKAATSERNATKEVLNCIRILQRVLPVVFEVEGESNAFELEVLWKKVQIDQDDGYHVDGPQFVIEDEDDDRSEHGEAASPHETLPSLGEKLFSCIMDLLFCCGFTLPTKIQVDHYKINYVIWEKGVGSTVDTGPNAQYDSNKIEVLRLLLVLFSRQIYVSPASLFIKPSFYTLHMVRKTPRRDVLTLLCSLLNTILNSSTSNNLTIASVAGKVPYNHLVFKGEDSRIALVGMCLQVLCALLDFQSGPAKDVVSGNDENTSTSMPTAQTNAFRYFIAKLHRTQDFAFILDGISSILNQQLAITNILLPGSRKSVPYIPETSRNKLLHHSNVMFSQKFRAYILDSDKVVDVLAYFFSYGLEIKDKPQQLGLCRALSYIIQTLSAEPAFGNKLCLPVKIAIPAKWSTPGTAADFMITSIYSMMATTSGTMSSLYPALIIALSNVAPYFKNLSIVSSNRLIQLFTAFANPRFLLSDESHPRLLFFILEVFNSVIFHHLSDNPNLLYAIITAHQTLQDLGTFTLASGLREIKHAELAKEERTRQGDPNRKSNLREADIEAGDVQAEKARLLLNESHRIVARSEGVESFREGAAEDEDEENTSILASKSEKVRGKMRERSVSSETTSSAELLASAGVGRNGFVPTQEWVYDSLPLDTVMLVISELLPKIQRLQGGGQKVTSTGEIIDFLRSVSLVGVLPPAPPLHPRKFMWSDASMVWLTSLIWGEIYVHGMSPLGIWSSTNVRLFFVKHTNSQPRQIAGTMSHVVGELFSQARQRPE
ncbi:high-temperature-induced dauer-formation protein-domain-containing protein [Pisolithus orientalis]|uniref:high-temperature-induced dauer-formation protein-domain-containing protein n=1 Tax=Pisolithus orientalis TaxID=936130 RepID=UPI0022251712|nr:high-temperature-induced dauer-formation protein-domain-containing protein [Pisolithus orientalis]KAI6028312.1 high-temperature-induced dauer-formation protein-domain-containing protein [Pisolithus orientalis]